MKNIVTLGAFLWIIGAFFYGLWSRNFKPVLEMTAGIGCLFLAFWIPRQIGQNSLNILIILAGVIVGIILIGSGAAKIWDD